MDLDTFGWKRCEHDIKGQNFPLGITAPCSLNKASGPCPPLLRVKPKGVLNLPTVKPSELTGHELQLVSCQGKCLHLCQRLDSPRRRREVCTRFGV
ncbi:hypothetical protein RJ640_006225 [Escallonia rubra]|uniref:Uncharacterized protein n=1 Tax=Escallonia rubra TaxID=112253 RepID=A0AA88U0F3_9ASTE|nr:hypothetical protein RJ640_011835 [Escallonia rubra]KAK2974033.1 hypothetical protein RJ640_006225 [Escallonia rubra]